MMAGGFIALHRQILDWEWYGNPNTLVMFIHLLLKANYEPGRFEGMEIKRGQVVTSLALLASQTGLSLQQTKTALKHLISTGEITNESYASYRVITIANYDRYQDKQQRNQQATNKASTKLATEELTSEQQQYNNNNNINNINKGTIYPPIIPPKGDDAPDEGFAYFWEQYPRKTAKQDAVKAWKKIKPSGMDLIRIMDGLKRWLTSDQWNRDGGQYIQYPATWLNKRLWEDNPQPFRPQKPAQPKVNPAADFEQRDYSDVPDDDMKRLADEIRRAREEGII
jgi:hypothetical protein